MTDLYLSPEAVERLAWRVHESKAGRDVRSEAVATLRALAAELAAAREAQKWRPIETAPRDGSVILAGYHREEGWWSDLYDAEEHGFDAATHGFTRDVAPLTHWLPLPGPPATDDEADAIRPAAARLRAERDAAWQAGAEAMRSFIADQVALTHRNCVSGAKHWPRHRRAYETGRVKTLETVADAIRALPLPGQPKEDAPPFQASTLDALLSVATDDEADAIRQAARRANIEVPE